MTDHLMHERITLKMLRYFYEVSQTLHFGQAAHNLNITNSPLSSQMKELESLLDTAVFERNSRNVELTKAGIALKTECESIFNHINSALDTVQQIARQSDHKIKIGIISSAFWAGLGKMIQSFNQVHPQYIIDMVEIAPNQQKQEILDGKIDIGFVRFADVLNTHPLASQQITDENLIIAVSDKHPLSQRKRINLLDLKDNNFCILKSNHSAAPELFSYQCMSLGFKPKITKEFIEPTSLMAYVESNDNIVAVIASSYSNHKWEHLRFIQLKDAIPAGLYAIYDGNKMTQANQLLLEHFQHFNND